MKKITVFVTAVLTCAGLLPATVNAEEWKAPTEFEIMVTEVFDEAKEYLPDVNDNGQLDICDICELYHYHLVFRAAMDSSKARYGDYDFSRYGDEFTEGFSVFDEDFIGKIRYFLNNTTGSDEEYPTATTADMYLIYYMSLNGRIPDAEEIRAELDGYQFHATDGAEYVDAFCEFVEGFRSDRLKPEAALSAEEEAIFTRLDSGELISDINEDGKLDYYDVYDLFSVPLQVESVEKNGGRILSYTDEFIAHVFSIGDLNGDGAVDTQDYQILERYFYTRGIDMSYTGLGINEHLREIESRLTASGETPDLNSAPATGDANCDGAVTLNDAVTVLQYIAMPEKYPLTEEGLKNADVHNTGNGVDAMDALALQQWDAYK